MVLKKKKVSARRQRVRDNISAEKFARLSSFANSPYPAAILILLGFIAGATALLSLDSEQLFTSPWRPVSEIISLAGLVIVLSAGAAVYVHHYQPRIVEKPGRALALCGLFLILLILTKAGSLVEGWKYLGTGSAVTCAIILTIAYNQRFGLGMTTFYSLLACFSVSSIPSYELFVIMMVGSVVCCFSLKEIRKRMKLIEVTSIASALVFVAAAAMGKLAGNDYSDILINSGSAALVTIGVGVIIQAFLPIIEKVFRIATSMTLKDYGDANQPLLKKLAMDAPGTYTHSLLVGQISEAAAESIGANGLLCRVGALYHDIGKVNKPPYFIENQMGSASRHDQLSPAMSQLVIVGHVKDGIEIAREFGIPSVLRQFIETHHGTTLIEYFYNEARKKQEQDKKHGPISDTEFRYPGPKPRSKEAAIVMLSDAIESAVRSQTELSPTRIEVIVHNMVMKRMQDGQFDDCDLTLRELSQIENSISKSLAALHHGRIAYPTAPDKQSDADKARKKNGNGNDKPEETRPGKAESKEIKSEPKEEEAEAENDGKEESTGD